MVWRLWYGGKPGQKMADEHFLDDSKEPIVKQIQKRLTPGDRIEEFTDEIHIRSRFGRLVGRAVPA